MLTVTNAKDSALWHGELNALEEVLKKAIAQRAKPCMSDKHTLKLAFQAVDFDEFGKPADSGSVSYPEFCAALERFGLYASQSVRGLYDRYNPGNEEALCYRDFMDGLYTAEKSWPPPSRRDAAEWHVLSGEQQRESPANRWANSTASLSPQQRPVRVMSIANDKHRFMKPLEWERDGSGAWVRKG